VHTQRRRIRLEPYILVAALLLGAVDAYAQTTITLLVLSDNNLPIRCDVIRYVLDGTSRALGETDKNGQIKIPAECDARTFLLFHPVEELAYYGDKLLCGDVGSGPVTLKSVPQPKPKNSQLRWNVASASVRDAVYVGDLGDALDPPDRPNGHSDVYRIYSALVFARHLNISKPLVLEPGTGRLVLSDSFKSDLAALQAGLEVPLTGRLDVATLTAAARFEEKNGPDSLNQTMDAGIKRRGSRQ
jgi:hypothetical protein